MFFYICVFLQAKTTLTIHINGNIYYIFMQYSVITHYIVWAVRNIKWFLSFLATLSDQWSESLPCGVKTKSLDASPSFCPCSLLSSHQREVNTEKLKYTKPLSLLTTGFVFQLSLTCRISVYTTHWFNRGLLFRVSLHVLQLYNYYINK